MLRVLLTVLQALPAQDSAALLKKAHRAEEHYEIVARTRAPTTYVRTSAGRCDEVVGRFCLTYDEPDEEREPPPEPAPVKSAREQALRALEAAASASPKDAATARGLVRLLVQSHRDSAAVQVATRYAANSPGPWADLLLGFAQHAAGDDTAAAQRLGRAIASLPTREQRRVRIRALLAGAESKRVARLDSVARAGYEAALWKLADPLYLTPGNEVRAEHLARYVWSRLLSVIATLAGNLPWGEDLEELTLRYGAVAWRERVPAIQWSDRDSYVEHYDGAQLAFLPESLLTVGVRETPAPGESWTLEAKRARSGYVPGTVRRVVPLPVQVTRFPAGDSVVLRVDAALPFDSVARRVVAGDRVRTALFVLPGLRRMLAGDTAVLRSAAGEAVPAADSARFSLQLTLPPGDYIYSTESVEDSTRLAGRARFAVQLLARPAGAPGAPVLSDVLVTRPLHGRQGGGRAAPALQGLPGVEAAVGDTVGLYAEVWPGSRSPRPGRYRVELEMVPMDAPAAPARVLAWLSGRGRASPRAARLGWTVDPTASVTPPSGGFLPVATDFAIPRVSAGLYALHLRVLDEASGAGTSSVRLVRIREAR